jgi:hypothetical protein
VQDLAKLSSMAQGQIEELENEGIHLTPAEIVEINAMAWAVESPESRLLLSRGTPVEIGTYRRRTWWRWLVGEKREGGAVLWPLTMHGADWFNRVGCRLPGTLLQELALAYAMQNGRSAGGELDKGPLASWFTVITNWAATLRCTRAELREAYRQLLLQDETFDAPPPLEGEDDSGMPAGEVSAFLATATKSDPEIIERHLACGYAKAMMQSIMAQNKVDNRPAASDPRIQADKALAYRVHQIRQSRKESVRGDR